MHVMSDPEIQSLLEECHSNDPTRQVRAIQSLLDSKAYVSVVALIEMLKSPDAVVRCTAAGALGYLGAKDTVTVGDALLNLLNDREVIVRSEAVDALGILGYAPAAERVRSLLLSDPEPLVRVSAAETLGDLGDARSLAELEVAIGDVDEAVRGYAANSIGLLGSSQLLPKIKCYAASEKSLKVKAELHGARYRLGASEDLDLLLKLSETVDEDQAANILNIIHDLTTRKLPHTLAADASRIRTSVEALAQRLPLLSADAEQVLDRLSKTDPSNQSFTCLNASLIKLKG